MNKSNWIHGACAVAFQLAVGAIPWGLGYTLPLVIAGAGAAGFFVGVEWMQEVRIKLQERGIRWPAPVSASLILGGFTGWERDRYFDCGTPAVLVALVYLGAISV